MKANLLTLLLAGFTHFCFGQWVQQQTPVKNNLTAIRFYNERTGYAAGDGGTLLRTKNGGRNWERMNFPSKDNLTSVTLVDSAVVIVTTSSYENVPAVYRSQDGGITWVRTLSAPAGLYAAGTPAKRVFAIGDSIYQSNNKGKKWSSVKDINNTSAYNYISFANEAAGMIGGNISGAFTYSAEFIRTADSGKTWYGSFPFDFPNANGFSTMDFVNADTAFMFTNFYNRFLPGDSSQLIMLSNFRLRQELSGPQWHFNAKVFVPSFPGRLNACRFFKTGIAYAVGDKGQVYRSANFGKNWKPEYAGKAVLNAIYMVNEELGYIAGDGGLILKKEAIHTVKPVANELHITATPNPANFKTTVRFRLTASQPVTIKITDATGKTVYVKAPVYLEKGDQQVELAVADLYKGLYDVSVLNGANILGSTRLVIVR